MIKQNQFFFFSENKVRNSPDGNKKYIDLKITATNIYIFSLPTRHESQKRQAGLTENEKH